MFRFIKHILGLLFIFAIGYLFGIKGVRFYEVTSGSMEPTINVGDRFIGISAAAPARGDILVLKDPTGKEDTLVKRLIGLPGDTITVAGGYVYVNGEKLVEPYEKAKPIYFLKTRVPPGKIFVLGDNRNDSSDSSVWGAVPLTYVKSRIIFRYWPFSRIGFMTRSRPSLTLSL